MSHVTTPARPPPAPDLQPELPIGGSRLRAPLVATQTVVESEASESWMFLSAHRLP